LSKARIYAPSQTSLGRRGSPLANSGRRPPRLHSVILPRQAGGLGMTVPDTFSAYYADLLQGTYDCLDRIVLNAFYPLGQTAGGMRTWWRHLHGDDSKLNDDRLRDMAGTFSRRLHAFCAKQGIPIIGAQAGDRKHELAEPYLPKDQNFCGLFLVIKGIAPAPVWEVKRNADGQITEIRHRKNWPYVKHFYFHLIDPEWGHVSIRMCSYPPFGAQVILNGHEWVERQAWRKKVVTVKDGNCFVEGSDFPGIGRLAAELNRPGAIGRLRKLCERWIYSTCLCFALPSENRKRSGFAYQYSVFQLELSRNLLFLRGTTMDEVYQKLIDRTRKPLDLKQVKTIFGFSYRPHQKAKRGRNQSEIFKAVEAPSYDLTVFKIRWRNLTLKIYDKGGRVLRIEAVVHNAKELRGGRMLDNLPGLIERARDMLVRFLDTIQAAHISFLDEAAFEGLSDPTTRGTKRLAGIDLNKARNRLVVDAVIALSTKPDGFTVAQLAESVHKRSGKPANAYSPRNAAYDLAKLTGKKLVRRIERSRRYAVDPFGVRTLCAYLLLREKVIKPLLAGVTRPYRRSPKIIAPLDQHYLKLRQELHQTFETIGFAAA